MKEYILIKLGGSLITQKDSPMTAREDVITGLAKEIKEVIKAHPDVGIILGNGAGSFGHYQVVEHNLKNGITKPEQTFGYTEVQDAVAQLNRKVIQALLKERISAVTVQPSAILVADNGKPTQFFIDSLLQLVKMNILPVVYGDIIADKERGCTIFSTEDVFTLLIEAMQQKNMPVTKVIHVGKVAGVLNEKEEVIPQITSENWESIQKHIYKPTGFDITGGMKHKIESSLEFAKKGIQTYIVDGQKKNTILNILDGKEEGTCIS